MLINLGELASTHIGADTIDIMLWNGNTGDYDDILGYEGFRTLQKVIETQESIQKYIYDYGVVDIEVRNNGGKTYMRIEIVKGC